MRLNAYLARAGVASRRASDELIKAGRVVVNGKPGALNTVVEAGDRVEVDGQLVAGQELRHVMLHKPRYVVATASDPEKRPTVVELVGGDTRVVPVGRLDFTTTGLLLLMNDGPLAHRLAHPSFEVEKVYVVDVEGSPSASVIRALSRGVVLDDGKTAPATVERIGLTRLRIVLHEGRNRQIRRMCDAVGHPATSLHRSGYAGLELGSLKPGAWRNLTRDEVQRLRVLTGIEEAPSRRTKRSTKAPRER